MLIGITPGRVLRWAPRWPCSDDAVLFDARSGDYWVLTPQARAALDWLQAEGAIERQELLSRMAALGLDAADAPGLLAKLDEAGLLMGLVDGSAVRLRVDTEI